MRKILRLLILIAVLISIAFCSLRAKAKLDLFDATASGNVVAIRSVLEKHPEIKDAYLRDGWTALTIASREGYSSAVNLLIEEGADVNKLEGGGNSALYWAVYKNHADVVSLLLQKGARVDNKCPICRSPADVAKDMKYYGILQMLMGSKERGPL